MLHNSNAEAKLNDVEQVTGGSPQPVATSHEPNNEIPFGFRLMSKTDMAAYLGVSDRTLEIWMRRRLIPYIKLGRTVRFRIASVLPYIDEKYTVAAGQARRYR